MATPLAAPGNLWGDEPFAVLYGDDVILGEDPACGQLMRAYEQFGSGVVGVKEVSREAIRKYSSLKVEHIQDNYFRCTDMVEKPQPGQGVLPVLHFGPLRAAAGNL